MWRSFVGQRTLAGESVETVAGHLAFEDRLRGAETLDVGVEHLVQEVAQVPGFDLGTIRGLEEVLRRTRFPGGDEEEEVEGVEFPREGVLGVEGLGVGVFDLPGILADGDLDGDAKGLVAEVGGGVVGAVLIQVRQFPAAQGIEEALHDHLQHLGAVGEAVASEALFSSAASWWSIEWMVLASCSRSRDIRDRRWRRWMMRRIHRGRQS